MAGKFNIEFKGHYRYVNIKSIPEISGIYGVSTCKFNETAKTVSLNKLVYIGESSNVNERINSHEKLKDWEKHLQTGEVLCFNTAVVSGDDRFNVEASLIYAHKPPVNTEYISHNAYPGTTIKSTGRNGLIKSQVSV
ncbi:MAG: GIY-YIG nuclease family protein [Clostridiales bacterium]|nr:GIY-YIG nuclease family protein [Clostridiales bacterium]